MNILSDLSEKKESLEHTAAGTLDARTRLYCLLGSPVSHSISPAMHNEAFRLLGLNCAYLAFDVDENTFERAVDGLITLNAGGWNCTMPLKRLMYERADELSDSALLSGAVNTVVNENGRLIGHNTDGVGFLRSVKDAGLSVAGQNLTVLGAGGAATAICVQAALDGVREISIFNRHAGRAERIVRIVNENTACHARAFALAEEDRLRQELAESELLVNATRVGMKPLEDQCVIPDASMLHPGLFVMDAIYEPARTRLLRMAEEAGCRTLNGLGMVLYQGAASFALWTGHEMPVELVRERLFRQG